jgi:alpha-L-arabinofuranosidase
MANIAQSVNVISPLTTTPDGLIRQTTYFPLYLFSQYMRGEVLAVHVRCGEYHGPTQPKWIRGTIETPWLDVSASINEDGMMCLAVVNVHETDSITARIEGIKDGIEVETYTVTGTNVDVVNTDGKQEVSVKRGDVSWDGDFDFRPHSLTVLRWHPTR